MAESALPYGVLIPGLFSNSALNLIYIAEGFTGINRRQEAVALSDCKICGKNDFGGEMQRFTARVTTLLREGWNALAGELPRMREFSEPINGYKTESYLENGRDVTPSPTLFARCCFYSRF
jgi:hypothetical protein